jgi:hypothetical protein
LGDGKLSISMLAQRQKNQAKKANTAEAKVEGPRGAGSSSGSEPERLSGGSGLSRDYVRVDADHAPRGGAVCWVGWLTTLPGA